MNIFSQLSIAKIKNNKNKILILIILLSWSHQWVSIGSFITIYNFSIDSIATHRNHSFLIFFINLVIFFFNKEKNIKNSIFFYICLIPAAYLLGLVNLFIDTPSEKDIFFLWHLTFVLQMINTLIILNNFYKIDLIDKAILLKINFLLIIIYLATVFISYDFSLKVEYYINFLNFKISTNTNGINRMFFVLNIFITCHYFINKKKITNLLLIFIINFLIILMQSRQGLVLISVQLLLIIFYCSPKHNLIKKMGLYFLLLIIIPMCLSFAYNNSLNNRLFLLQGELRHDMEIINNNSKSKQSKEIEKAEYLLDKFSTGRFNKWKISLTHIINSEIKNIIFGNGPEFDRKLLISKRGNDIANGIFYILLCGGLFGLLVFFKIIQKTLGVVLSALYSKKKLNNDVYFCFSFCCVISLALRSLVENGFVIYGVDFLLITSSFFYILKKLKFI